MRKVIWSAMISVPVVGSGRCAWELQEQGEAVFHQFGVDYEEFESGAGNYSTAIIELDDGTVKSIPVEHIKFMPDEPKEIFPGTYAGLDKLTIKG